MSKSLSNLFGINGRVAVITGGAGLLGIKHAEAIAIAGGIPVMADINAGAVKKVAQRIRDDYGIAAQGYCIDVTKLEQIRNLLENVLKEFGQVDILVNNAANDPKADVNNSEGKWSRFENFTHEQWQADIAVGLTGAFFCSQVFGSEMARRGQGVILNVASDLSIIAPDQRIYHKLGVPDAQQPVKPVSYSVVKTGLLGLTRYLSTYWADKGVRVNAISPGGVFNGQTEEFVKRLTSLIPMARMAALDEYQGAIIFLCSDASAYMTGANLIMDGGRTIW